MDLVHKLFSHVIAPFLLKVYEESIEKTVLPATLCQGLITLIPKSNKDPLFIDNWRPITLLNNDYNILALVLAKRLKHVLNSIIDETQSGFMQKRHISNNIRLVLDMMDYSDYINSDGFIFCCLLSIKKCSVASIEGIAVKNSLTYLGIQITKDEYRCSANFKPIIAKTQRRCNCWLQRDLSLKGRTLLTKAEGLSRLAYAAQSLFVDKSTCKTINDVLINFLWKNKTHYIRKSVILNSYNKGGLNFINFDSLNNTFKINWLKQYLSKPTSIWNTFPQLIFSQFGGLPFLLMCNYDISKLPIKLSNFHRQALLAWTLIYKHNFSPQRCFIWNNKNILFKNKSLYYANWFSNGLVLVQQLFNNQGLLLRYSEFLSKYQIPITSKEFAVVMGAIPSGLCMLIKNCRYSSTVTASFPNPCDTPVGQICFSESRNKNYRIRSLFLENLISAPHVKHFWNNLFDNLNWKKVWSLEQKFFLTNKVKEVSFKLIHRFYPVKKFIQKFRADVELSCSFCLNADETVEHLFWSCQYTQRFWYDIDAFVKLKLLPEFSIQIRNIIFGYFDSDPTKENISFIINLILILSKFYIHKCKFSNCKPVFTVFLRDIENYINLISVSNNKKAIKTVRICTAFKVLV